MAQPVDAKLLDESSDKREMTLDELDAIAGGDAKPPQQSNHLKKIADTATGIVANLK